MRLPIIVREHKVAFAVGATVALFAIFFAYLAAVNPTWSPVEGLRGDGSGVSNAQKQEEEKVEAQERLRGALQFIPSTAIMATHANLSAVEGGQAWWTYYNRFTPATYTLPDALPEELGVTSITYASFPTQTQGFTQESPFSDVLVLTAPKDKGEAILGYVNAENNGVTYAHFTQDEEQSYVIISDMPGYETIATLVSEGETETKSFASLARANDFSVDAPSPTMYVNMSDYISIITDALPEKKDFVNTLMTQGVGLKEKTTWLGSSPDQGLTWEGSFLSGGIDVESVDPVAFNTAILGEMEFISGNGIGLDNEPSDLTSDSYIESGYVLEGLSTVSQSISVAKGQETVGQITNPHDLDSAPVVADAPTDDEDIVIVFSPQMFLSSFHGVVKSFAVHTITLRVTGENSTLKFDFYEEDDFAIPEDAEGTVETEMPIIQPPTEQMPQGVAE